MAERPVFVICQRGSRLVEEIRVHFIWNPGMATSQKRKNIIALHKAAAIQGLSPLLEISSKSESKVGQELSAFNLKIRVEGKETTIECAFQGSKVFENGGPFHDLYWVDSREAKRDPRLRESGRLVCFRMEEKDYPLAPTTSFYDWLYVNALYPRREWFEQLQPLAGFTDIEFNPERSLNCQARSCATFAALQQRGLLDEALESFEGFRDLMQPAGI